MRGIFFRAAFAVAALAAAPLALAVETTIRPVTKNFVENFEKKLVDAEAMVSALTDKGASPAAISLAMELLRAESHPHDVAERALERALENSKLAEIVEKAHPKNEKLSRTKQLLNALKAGSLLQTLNGEQVGKLAGAIRVELRAGRRRLAAKQNPNPRKEIIRELEHLGKLAGALTPAETKLIVDGETPTEKLLSLVGSKLAAMDLAPRSVSPATAPQRLRDFRNAMQANPVAFGECPGNSEKVFQIPGHSVGGGRMSLDDAINEGVRFVQPPRSTEIALPKGPRALDSNEERTAQRLKSVGQQLGSSPKSPAYPIELFTDQGPALCNGAFATGNGKPVELGVVDGVLMCEMPYQTAAHCVTPRPNFIRIPRVSSAAFAAPRIRTSRRGDQATIGIQMPCEEARKLTILRIAKPEEVANAQFGILLTNPVRHRDDGKRALVLGLTPGNADFLAFNAALTNDKDEDINDGAGTRVGDSGGPLVVQGANGEFVFAGVNSFGTFVGGDPNAPGGNPNLYARQGGIAFRGREDALARNNDVRDLATATATALTAARPPVVATHKRL